MKIQNLAINEIDLALKELGDCMKEALRLDKLETNTVLQKRANHKKLTMAQDKIRSLQVSN